MSEDLTDPERNSSILRHVVAFEEKVNMCVDTFSRKILKEMCLKLSQYHGDIDSVSKVQKFLTDEPTLPGVESERVTRYFQWFLDNHEYLKELNRNFEIRIYQPLIRYFNVTSKSERSSAGSWRSAIERPPSIDSDFTDMGTDSDSEIANEIEALTQLQASQSRDAILLMSQEFKDISSIYDNSDLENIAKRLIYLKERLDFLLEEEGEVNPDLFSLDSESPDKSASTPIKVQNFIRLIPDILVKCQKAAKLSRQWLEADKRKAIDLNAKLEKISEIKLEMTKKLNSVEKKIDCHEKELERQTSELQNLLGREERTNELDSNIHVCDKEISALTLSLKKVSQEKENTAKQLVQLGKQSGEARNHLLLKYKEARLQRQALKRRIAFQKYRKSILEEDVGIEMSLKPNIIRLTNDTQDSCEKIEKMIDDEHVEQQRLHNALMPINEDILRVQSQLEQQSACSSRLESVSGDEDFGVAQKLNVGSDCGVIRPNNQVRKYREPVFITEHHLERSFSKP